MFKWPVPPLPSAPAHEIADFIELVCWKRRSTSINAVGADLRRLDENDYSQGVHTEEETTGIVEEAFGEVERRNEVCRGGYPFEIDSRGYTLRLVGDSDGRRYVAYRYLLLATRLNMKSSRRHAGIDGALLLEQIAAEAAREYLGERAESMVFGSGSSGPGFVAKVNDLCSRIQEGDGFYSRGGGRARVNDGKLDVVAWKHFTDRLPGKLVAFGQCKTGTHYGDSLTQLQPDSFCGKWFRSHLAFVPIRMFFVAEALSRSRWYDMVSDAGLLFDRCRIVDFCDDVSEDVLAKVARWTYAAARAAGLTI